MSSEDFSLRLSESDSENQTHLKNDDAKRTQESPQNQRPVEILESEESEVIRFERSIKNISTVTNQDSLADNVCKNISEISNADFGNFDQLNSSSNFSEELSVAIFDSTITSDSSAEFLGFKNLVHSSSPNAADKKRQALKKIITTSSEKNLSTNQNWVSTNFESSEAQEENLPLNYDTDSSIEFLGFQNSDSERNSKRKVGTNNNSVSSDFKSVKRKNDNISKINSVNSYRFTKSGSINLSLRHRHSSSSSEESSDSNQESLISSEESSHSSIDLVGLKKSFHIDEISHSKKNDDKNIPSSASSNSSTKILGLKTTSSQSNLSTNQNNVSSDFESIRKKKKNIPLSSSSESSTEFSDFAKTTSTTKNLLLKRRRYYKPSSSDESDDSSLNNRNRFRARIERNNKRRKIIRKSSSSDSEDTVHKASNLSKISSRSKNKLSSSDENFSSSVKTAKSNINDSVSRKLIRTSSSSDSEAIVYTRRNLSKRSSTLKKSSANACRSVIKVSRRRKEEKIKKLRTYFINANVDLRRQKYFWRDCQSNVDTVLKWIKNKKNINNLIKDPRELQREIELHLELLELNTRSIISLNKRVTRSQTAAQRWQHFLKYGNTVKSIF